ncbi:hypothetical protein [Streptomyces sp. CAU 1734]|uniref:hypothetical protein n=1 Tax=Streptomyces sp. CAU 1734 TaxID=3140360 RepID=UPI00326121B8
MRDIRESIGGSLLSSAATLLAHPHETSPDVWRTTWINALTAAVGLALVIDLAADAAAVLTTVAPPVRTYLTTHTQGLPVDAATAYALWQITGLVGLVAGFIRITAARTLWITWGAASVAMIRQTAPDSSRTVATGIAWKHWLNRT